MGTIAIGISICACGEPAASPVHGPNGHQYVPDHIAETLRPTQTYKPNYQRGRYQVKESRIVTTAKPAAGVDVKATVPGATKWKVWSLRASLTTSAIAANRVPHLQITDGPNGHVVTDFPAGNNQLAASTINYAAGAGVVAANFDNTLVFVLPVDVVLLQGWTLGFATTALDAGDQWTALALLVTETLYF